MNRPETQEKLRHDLFSALGRFLDTSPEGKSLERLRELLVEIKEYFVRELDEVEASDSARTFAVEQVLASLSATIQRILTDEKYDRVFDGEPVFRPPTPEEMSVKPLKEGEHIWEREGKRGSWD